MGNDPFKTRQDVFHGLDLVEGARAETLAQGDQRGAGDARPFLQVWFRCANVYQRVYRERDGNGYRAVCGKCGKTMNFVIGPGGTTQRVFEVSC